MNGHVNWMKSRLVALLLVMVATLSTTLSANAQVQSLYTPLSAQGYSGTTSATGQAWCSVDDQTMTSTYLRIEASGLKNLRTRKVEMYVGGIFIGTAKVLKGNATFVLDASRGQNVPACVEPAVDEMGQAYSKGVPILVQTEGGATVIVTGQFPNVYATASSTTTP